MARETASKGALLPGYQATLADVRSKERYNEKLKFFGGNILLLPIELSEGKQPCSGR